MRITNKKRIHDDTAVPVYCLEIPNLHNFTVQIDKSSDVVVKNCASYNLDM